MIDKENGKKLSKAYATMGLTEGTAELLRTETRIIEVENLELNLRLKGAKKLTQGLSKKMRDSFYNFKKVEEEMRKIYEVLEEFEEDFDKRDKEFNSLISRFTL